MKIQRQILKYACIPNESYPYVTLRVCICECVKDRGQTPHQNLITGHTCSSSSLVISLISAHTGVEDRNKLSCITASVGSCIAKDVKHANMSMVLSTCSNDLRNLWSISFSWDTSCSTPLCSRNNGVGDSG